jgi:hypothetical protein
MPGNSNYTWLGKSTSEVTINALTKLMETDLGSSESFGNTTVKVHRLDGSIAAIVIAEMAVAGISNQSGLWTREGRIRDCTAKDVWCFSRNGWKSHSPRPTRIRLR